MAFLTVNSPNTPIEIVKYNNGLEDVISLRVGNHSASLVMSTKEAEELIGRIQAILAQPLQVAA
jgi:hypothetical protein